MAEHLDERARRLWAATEAQVIGHGGVTAVSRATGFSRQTITDGLRELKGQNADEVAGPRRVRKEGAGRKRTTDLDPTLKIDLDRLVDPVTRGDPESALRWTCKSARKLAVELGNLGHKTSVRMVSRLLHEAGYSLQANSKTIEGERDHPDRNAQFENISEKVKAQMAAGDPVVSVDTKKKELVGDFKNAGRELRPKGDPEKVRVYDFILEDKGKVAPYGVYDIAKNEAWVSVGTDHDTSTFAVETLRRWWKSMGQEAYPDASKLLITADGGGSNGSRVRLWKIELQGLANELGMPISVCHFPPGTSKWNKIEHRLFSFITLNWRGRPLVSHEVIVSLIGATTTKKGLRVRSELDRNSYPTGRKVTDKEISEVNIVRDEFHGEWNYTVFPLED